MRSIIPGSILIALCAASTPSVSADTLTIRAQQDLVELGYDVGEIDGQVSIKTAIAIAAFQAEKNIEVTGEVTPLLVGALKSDVKRKKNPDDPDFFSYHQKEKSPEQKAADLQLRQQECLQEKVAAAKASAKKKRGLGRLFGAVARTVTRSGNFNSLRKTQDVYNVTMTAEDLAAAAKDLGITEDDVAACQNPGV